MLSRCRTIVSVCRKGFCTARQTVPIVFREAKSGVDIKVNAEVGKTLLDAALEYDVDVEGACGGEMACSTCHMVLSEDLFNRLPNLAEEEEDMLDLAVGLTDTSRLGCQIKVTEDMENEIFIVPQE